MKPTNKRCDRCRTFNPTRLEERKHAGRVAMICNMCIHDEGLKRDPLESLIRRDVPPQTRMRFKPTGTPWKVNLRGGITPSWFAS